MSDTATKRHTRNVFELGFGAGRLDVVDAALAPGAVDRHPFAPDEPDMAAHLKAAIGMFRAAIPDLQVTIRHLVEEDNVLAAHVEMTGHHSGAPLMGIPASGTDVAIEQFHIIEVDSEGRGVRHWANVGLEQLQAQLSTPVH
jgi:predicted ester cyclase